jgi:hypothetical protein
MPPVPTSTPSTEAEIISTAELYFGPGRVYQQVDTLDIDDKLDILGQIENSGWINVAVIGSDVKGWVPVDLVRIIGNNPIPSIEPNIQEPLPPGPTLTDPQSNAAQVLRIDLEWDWDAALGPNDYFQVEIRNRKDASQPVIDETVPTIDVAWVKDKFYLYHYVDYEEYRQFNREYTWRVVVVRGQHKGQQDWSIHHPDLWVWKPSQQSVPISQPSEMRTLYVEPNAPPKPKPTDDKTCPPGDRSC